MLCLITTINPQLLQRCEFNLLCWLYSVSVERIMLGQCLHWDSEGEKAFWLIIQILQRTDGMWHFKKISGSGSFWTLTLELWLLTKARDKGVEQKLHLLSCTARCVAPYKKFSIWWGGKRLKVQCVVLSGQLLFWHSNGIILLTNLTVKHIQLGKSMHINGIVRLFWINKEKNERAQGG